MGLRFPEARRSSSTNISLPLPSPGPFARWADTVHKLGLLHFSTGILIWVMAGILDLTCCFPLGLCLIVVLGAWYRAKIRKLYRLPRSWGMDLVAWVLCMPCAIAQVGGSVVWWREIRVYAVRDCAGRTDVMVERLERLRLHNLFI